MVKKKGILDVGLKGDIGECWLRGGMKGEGWL